MTVPDWRTLDYCGGVIPGPTPGHGQITVWVRGNCVSGIQEWERISTSAHAAVAVEDGICTAPATLIHARQRVRGFFGRLFQRFGNSSDGPHWLLPNGHFAEQCGQR